MACKNSLFCMKLNHLNKFTGLVLVLAIYVLAVLVGLFATLQTQIHSPLWQMAFANIVATLVVYLFSALTKNASIYDPYWSLIPILTVFYWFRPLLVFQEATAYHWIVIALVAVWGIRLTINWILRWKGIKDEDWRYTQLRKKTKKWFPMANLWGIHLMPTILTFLGSLPLYFFYGLRAKPNVPLFVIAALITFSAIVIETVADYQLRRFRNSAHTKNQRLKSGVWRRLNHPNYLGEVAFWWGIYLFGLSINTAYWRLFLGPVAITFLFVFVSIPMMDQHLLHKK